MVMAVLMGTIAEEVTHTIDAELGKYILEERGVYNLYLQLSWLAGTDPDFPIDFSHADSSFEESNMAERFAGFFAYDTVRRCGYSTEAEDDFRSVILSFAAELLKGASPRRVSGFMVVNSASLLFTIATPVK